jgi:ABC-type branched-subunit amino acid transport system ATPase component
MTESGSILEANEVDMRFGGVRALNGVSIRLDHGDTVGLIGPNGSGKSTLLNVLTGVYRQSAGSIVFNGRDISRTSARLRGRLGIGRTFQHPQVAASLTLRENVLVAAQLGHLGSSAQAMSTDEALEVFGCSEYAHSLPAHAPYGLLKLLEIARAVVRAPQVLLLDEPAAGLNQEERVELIASLRRYRATSTTAIGLIEHDVELVRSLCPSLVVLESGRLLAHGPTDEVLRDPRVRDAYLGDDMKTATEELP